MKTFLRRLARRFGLELVHHDSDGVLRVLLEAQAELRLCPDKLLRWDHLLPRIASLGHLRSQLRRHTIDLVIDVGANRGQFALDVRRAGYGGEILSFEPLAAHQSELAQLAAQDGYWKIIPCALGIASAELDLHVYHDDSFSSLHRSNATAQKSFGHMVRLDHVERVPVRTLDAVCAELGIDTQKRVLLKSDTQGHDGDVLRGASRVLEQTQVVLTEANLVPIYDNATRIEELETLLLPRGFVRAGQFPISYNPVSHELMELDCFFARPTSAGASPAHAGSTTSR